MGFWGWQWHQLDHMQTICTLLQTDNHTNTSSLDFYMPDKQCQSTETCRLVCLSVCDTGALFAFEMLCVMLGRLFEPYVVHLLPHLLLCFGDSNQYVREVTDNTAPSTECSHRVGFALNSRVGPVTYKVYFN